MEIIQRLRSSAKTLLVQCELHGRLAAVEWQEEKARLQQLVAMTLLGFLCLLCCMIFIGLFIVAIAWHTEYRILSIGGVMVLYATGVLLSYIRIKSLVELGSATFAATREEIAADIALIRSRL